MFRRLAEAVMVFKWPTLLGLALITLMTGWAALRLRIDPSMETLFIKKSPEYQYYREYREKYGSDQMVAVAMATVDLFTVPNLRRLKKLTDDIAEFPEVERVLSLANAMDIKHKFLGVKVVPALGDFFKRERTPAELKNEILSNELFVNNLVSKDGKVANILVYLKPPSAKSESAASNGTFLSKLRKDLKRDERPGLKFYVAGSPVEQYDFIRLIRRDQFTFVPLITLLLILTTFLIYRNVPCMVLAMSIVFMTLLWTLGTITLLGQELNLMTSLLAPVIMIISVINSIYLMNLFLEIRPHHGSLTQAVVVTIEQLGMPCLLTHFTTVLGFISLAFNPIPAIQSFGVFAALGTLYSYVIEILLTIILLPLLPYRNKKGDDDERHLLNRVIVGYLEKLDFQWKRWILLLTALVLVFSIKGLTKIQVDTNIVKQMKPDLPLAISTRFIDQHLTGVYSLGFVLKRKDGGTFVDAAALRKIDRFKDFLEAKPEIAKVNGITTLIKKLNQAKDGSTRGYHIPDNPDLLKRYFDGILESGDPEAGKIISPDFKEIRLDARMRAVGTTQGALVEETAKSYLNAYLSKDFEYHLTGNVVLLGKMAKGLVHEQMQSFLFAFVSILIVIILIFRSIRLGLLAAIPNLFPILAVYGLMGFWGIELSTPTAMISSIVLGLVVDASIQFLYRFRMEFEHRGHYLQALHHTYRNTGQSMVVSSMILVVGFASSVFANFRPTIYFGLLTSLTILLALVCTLVVLPVCLIMFKPFGPQKLFRR